MGENEMCQHPDRDVPGLVCGYPLPCPYHTVVIHADKTPTTVEISVTATRARRVRRQLENIARALSEEESWK